MKAIARILSILSLLITAACVAQAKRPVDFSLAAEAPCSEATISTMRSSIEAKATHPEQLLSVISSLLCESPDASNRVDTVFGHLAESVRHTQSDLGSPTASTVVHRDRELASEMTLATNVDYASLRLRGQTLCVVEYSGDICTRSVTIAHNGTS